MKGDVTLTKSFTTVIVTLEDQIDDPEAVGYYLAAGYEITHDERAPIERMD